MSVSATFYISGDDGNADSEDLVAYGLDDDTNDLANTANPSGTMVLKDLSKTRCTFDGWHSDTSFINKNNPDRPIR